jgi:hypothetical protein
MCSEFASHGILTLEHVPVVSIVEPPRKKARLTHTGPHDDAAQSKFVLHPEQTSRGLGLITGSSVDTCWDVSVVTSVGSWAPEFCSTHPVNISMASTRFFTSSSSEVGASAAGKSAS